MRRRDLLKSCLLAPFAGLLKVKKKPNSIKYEASGDSTFSGPSVSSSSDAASDSWLASKEETEALGRGDCRAIHGSFVHGGYLFRTKPYPEHGWAIYLSLRVDKYMIGRLLHPEMFDRIGYRRMHCDDMIKKMEFWQKNRRRT